MVLQSRIEVSSPSGFWRVADAEAKTRPSRAMANVAPRLFATWIVWRPRRSGDSFQTSRRSSQRPLVTAVLVSGERTVARIRVGSPGWCLSDRECPLMGNCRRILPVSTSQNRKVMSSLADTRAFAVGREADRTYATLVSAELGAPCAGRTLEYAFFPNGDRLAVQSMPSTTHLSRLIALPSARAAWAAASRAMGTRNGEQDT